jgi:hypothetical protein
MAKVSMHIQKNFPDDLEGLFLIHRASGQIESYFA